MSSANFTKWEVAGTRLGEGLCNPPKAVGPLCTYMWGSNGHCFLLHHGDRDAGVCTSCGVRAGLGSQDPGEGYCCPPSWGPGSPPFSRVRCPYLSVGPVPPEVKARLGKCLFESEDPVTWLICYCHSRSLVRQGQPASCAVWISPIHEPWCELNSPLELGSTVPRVAFPGPRGWSPRRRALILYLCLRKLGLE